MLCLPKGHRYAKRKPLSLEEMDGESPLLYRRIGFWGEVVKEKMPHSHFLAQDERYPLRELILHSALPCFVSDLSIDPHEENGRTAIPIVDPEANVSYCLVCPQSEKEYYQGVFFPKGR